MQKVLIVEDDIEQLHILSDTLSANYPSWTVSIADKYEDAVSLISESVKEHQPYSLFLFDVQLSADATDKSGFELGKQLRSFEEYYSTPVLFLTAIPDDKLYALHNVHYYDYIPKPYTQDDILNRLQDMLMHSILAKDTFTVTDTDAINHRISPKDIKYIHSNTHKVFIHLKNYTITTRNMNITTILGYVSPQCIKCHNRYLVNTSYVTNFDPVNRCIKIDNNSIPVSKAYVHSIKELFQKG